MSGKSLTEMNLPDQKSSALLHVIVERLLLFPAYNEAKTLESSPSELFALISSAYENDQLTEEQDLILESLLYLYNQTEEFDLRRGLAIWDEGDFLQFQATLSETRKHSLHSDSSDSI